MKELNAIRDELKAPKGQHNAFGNYKYRSCEDILEALKPLLKKHEACLVITDEMVVLGDRYYVKAMVQITTDKTKVEVCAYAREALTKKGMDEAQITGSASSYARKYALNGMFCIDDTKDADYAQGKDAQTTPGVTKPAQTAPKTEETKDIPETPAMQVRAAKLADLFRGCKTVLDANACAAQYREEINTTMSIKFKAWLKDEFTSAKENLALNEAGV